MSVELDGKEYSIQGPFLFWALPGHSYRFLSDAKWTRETLWLDMSGKRADRIADALSKLNILGISIVNELPFFQLVKNIIEITKTLPEEGKNHRITLLMEEVMALLYDEVNASKDGSGLTANILAVASLLRNEPDKKHNIHLLARQYGVSYDFFRKKFKKYMGFSPGEYLTNARMDLAVDLLKNTHQSIKEIAFACGYSDVSVFSRMFRKRCSCYPGQYRQLLTASVKVTEKKNIKKK